MRRWLLLISPALALLATPASGEEKLPLAEWLSREIIGPRLAMQEVQEYIEPRVPKVPEFRSVPGWEKYAARTRAEVLEKIVFRGRAAQWRDAETKVEWLDPIPGGEGYSLRKVRYEALPGMWIPAILYEPDRPGEKVPVMLAVNGHEGVGKVVGYKQTRCINLAKRGVRVLNVEWLGMGQLRGPGYQHYAMNQLDLCGASGLAPFYLSMKRGLDLLLSLPKSDPGRVAVSGLSGGGWQTIVISALDERVTLANPVAGYSSFRTRVGHLKDLGDSEQTPCDLATVADYTHLTAMRAPRPTLLTYNSKDDCCFESGYALPPLVDAAMPVFKLYGKPEALRTHVNHDPGTHNYERENREALY
ncbi:MAG TPA: acetylxylan esterase, partial [Gemmataceae bacterium]